MIKVIIADDHNVVRQGIYRLLDDDEEIKVLGEAASGEEAIQLTEELNPDVLVLDYAMPRLSGIDTVAHIRAKGLKTQVVILSMHDDATLARQALQQGAVGYVAKQAVAGELLAAVKAASRRSVYLSSSVAEALLATETEPIQDIKERLSPRERRVVQLVSEGLTTQAIAHSLGVSVKTIEKQRRNAMNKLGVENVAQLVKLSIQLGLVAPDVGTIKSVGSPM